MKKLSLKILTLLMLVLCGSQTHAAAAAAAGEDGAIKETVFKSQVLKAIDLVYGHDEDARSKISQERRAFQGTDRAIKIVGEYGETQYIIWGSKAKEPMAADLSAFPGEVATVLSEEVEGESHEYIHLKRYEEVLPTPSRSLKVSPDIFEIVRAEYPFIHFTDDINVLSGIEGASYEKSLTIPAKTAVVGAAPDEGFVATGGSLVRILNTKTSMLGLINDYIDGSTIGDFNKVLKEIQGDSLPEYISILIQVQRFGVDEIALGKTLIDLGYSQTIVSAFPGVFGSPVHYFISGEAKDALVNPVLEEWNIMLEKGEVPTEGIESPTGEKYYAQTSIVSPDGSTRTFLNKDANYLSMEVPKLPEDADRKWYITSSAPFIPEPAEASAAALSASVDA
tara:strand:- start:45719 stop:46900 length:1182 start_codon:yes stop_codon:yes gene_type:complete